MYKGISDLGAVSLHKWNVYFFERVERVERVVTVAGSSDSAAVAFLARDRVGFGASSFDDAAVRVFEIFFSVSSTASCFLGLPRAAFFGGLSTISPDACRLRVDLFCGDSSLGS